MDKKSPEVAPHLTLKNVVALPPGSLVASPWNRKGDNGPEMKELIESVRRHGILQPLIVRKITDTVVSGGFIHEIVAGHRRWDAALALAMDAVPCIITHLGDQDAKLTQIVENAVRKNLNPMEECDAFRQLSAGNAHSVQTISEMVGKDVKYIHRSIALANLPVKAQDALRKGILSAAHGHQLVRVGEKQIDTLIEFAITPNYHGEIPSVGNLRLEISKKVERNLAGAPFEKTKDYAGKIACKGCPSNTANQDVLFEGAEQGHCTNGGCFSAKMKQFYKDLESAGIKRWPNLPYIGAAVTRYGNTQVIQGHKVVEKLSESDGFGILKPSNWGTVKVPKLVLLKKLKNDKVAGTSQEPDYEHSAHLDFVCEYIRKGIKKDEEALDKKRDKLVKDAKVAWKKDKKSLIEKWKKEHNVK